MRPNVRRIADLVSLRQKHGDFDMNIEKTDDFFYMGFAAKCWILNLQQEGSSICKSPSPIHHTLKVSNDVGLSAMYKVVV